LRVATEAEIAAAPAWARKAAQRGDQLNVCVLGRSATLALHGVARHLARACVLAALPEPPTPGDARLIAAAREFLNKIDRVDFELMARKARMFAGVYERWSPGEPPLCEPGHVSATEDRAWDRITTLTELRAVGRELTNCLARTNETSAYGGRLKDGQAQFWALRDARGVALMAAMAPTAGAHAFIEVKGPRNTPVSRTNPDLRCLAKAILLDGDVPPASALRDDTLPPPTFPEPPTYLSFGLPRAGIPSISAPIYALDSLEEIARLRFASTDVVITRRRRRAS
jgi:hypothetical protein